MMIHLSPVVTTQAAGAWLDDAENPCIQILSVQDVEANELKVTTVGSTVEKLQQASWTIESVHRQSCPKIERISAEVSQSSEITVNLKFNSPLIVGTYRLSADIDQNGLRGAERVFTAQSSIDVDVDPKPRIRSNRLPDTSVDINYLAKDFDSFRRVALDRLAVLLPDWKERHEADLGIVLTELLAYTADYLSYFQDSVSTEAYLDTSRQRISVKRHARLVDYELDEGCNARVFLQFRVSQSVVALRQENVLFATQFSPPTLAKDIVHSYAELQADQTPEFEGFELVKLPLQNSLHEDLQRNLEGIAGWFIDRLEQFPGLFRRNTVEDLQQSFSSQRGRLCKQQMQSFLCELEKVLQCCCLSSVYRAPDDSDVLVSQCAESDDSHLQENLSFLNQLAPQHFPVSLPPGDVLLHESGNHISVLPDQDDECCLPQGATSAVLIDEYLPEYSPPVTKLCEAALQLSGKSRLDFLRTGDFLAFYERVGSRTGLPQDANPQRRHIVRLSEVRFEFDSASCRRLVRVKWNAEDALPFELCLQSRRQVDRRLIRNVSVATSNIALADHGITLNPAEQISVASEHIRPVDTNACRNTFPNLQSESELVISQRPFRPVLSEQNLTFAEPIPKCASATRLLSPKSHQAKPAIQLKTYSLFPEAASANCSGSGTGTGNEHFNSVCLPQYKSSIATHGADCTGLITLSNGQPNSGTQRVNLLENSASIVGESWSVVKHLLESGPNDAHFVVDVDNQRRAQIRFGDGQTGRELGDTTDILVSYRTGTGEQGNIGADKIGHVLFRQSPVSGIESISNPLPARGGTAPESLQHARLFAPKQFRKIRRGILPIDYVELIKSDFPDCVQGAVAKAKTTSVWTEILIAIDPFEGEDDEIFAEVQSALEKYRRIGHRVHVCRPIDVPLEITLRVFVSDGYFKAHVRSDLMDVFSSKTLVDGSLGFFHPDRLTFGSPIYLSEVVSLARTVSGVENVIVEVFRRRGEHGSSSLEAGVMNFDQFEIPRLESECSAPARGQLTLNMEGEE